MPADISGKALDAARVLLKRKYSDSSPNKGVSVASEESKVVLRPVGLSWIKGAADDPADLCAHGHVEFRVGDALLVDPATGPEVTVSAAALYLLRTLSKPHTKAQPVGDHSEPENPDPEQNPDPE